MILIHYNEIWLKGDNRPLFEKRLAENIKSALQGAGDFSVMRELYQRFYDSATVKYIEVNPNEAEAGKLLANFYLFGRLPRTFL